MTPSVIASYRGLLEAASFAAWAHRHQVRKDGRTPYAAHVFRVCLIVRHVFGIEDPGVLQAALLHDTIEDTDTDFDDLEERFGREVAHWAADLCKDMRMPEKEREAAYVAHLARAPWQVKICKLADIFDNIVDSQHLRPEKKEKSSHRWRAYLDAVATNLPDQARAAHELVETLYDEVCPQG